MKKPGALFTTSCLGYERVAMEAAAMFVSDRGGDQGLQRGQLPLSDHTAARFLQEDTWKSPPPPGSEPSPDRRQNKPIRSWAAPMGVGG